ncbi:hypothetical protein CN367_11665 [Priestia megaterium]|uniref:hypothetical protein n=1 Tax=Priestia megaterium TaxID=1404 RepID=UPI000BF6591C|nr:hypothetical protein [Priestia megaterium]PEZ47021.1 hypothetical protein CN367_11665 [Priestia megaterium]
MLKDIQSIAGSEMVFAVLFIFVLFIAGKWVIQFIAEMKDENAHRETQLIDLYKEQITNSNTREQELMKHLDKNTDQLENIADTLSDVQKNLSKLESKVDADLKDVWKELGGKADKIN